MNFCKLTLKHSFLLFLRWQFWRIIYLFHFLRIQQKRKIFLLKILKTSSIPPSYSLEIFFCCINFIFNVNWSESKTIFQFTIPEFTLNDTPQCFILKRNLRKSLYKEISVWKKIFPFEKNISRGKKISPLKRKYSLKIKLTRQSKMKLALNSKLKFCLHHDKNETLFTLKQKNSNLNFIRHFALKKISQPFGTWVPVIYGAVKEGWDERKNTPKILRFYSRIPYS